MLKEELTVGHSKGSLESVLIRQHTYTYISSVFMYILTILDALINKLLTLHLKTQRPAETFIQT